MKTQTEIAVRSMLARNDEIKPDPGLDFVTA